GPRGVPGLIVTKRLRVEGLVVMDFYAGRDTALAELRGWVEAGKLTVQEDIIDGLENLPAALIGLLAGEKRGKRMVRVGGVADESGSLFGVRRRRRGRLRVFEPRSRRRPFFGRAPGEQPFLD